MRLYNHTLLRGYLAHLHANVRKLIALHHERNICILTIPHPERPVAKDTEETPRMGVICGEWETLRAQLPLIIDNAVIKPFSELGHPGGFEATSQGGNDPFRITMKAFKLKADKARRQRPELTLMYSWDLATHECPKDSDGQYLVPEI